MQFLHYVPTYMSLNIKNYKKEEILFHRENNRTENQFQIHATFSGNETVLLLVNLNSDHLMSLLQTPK